jgi:RNA polymerase sigma factor (sigma-70 family)
MPKRWDLTQEVFERLLAWLDPEREEAGKKYEEIRHSLIKIFAWRGFIDAEDLADETINRVSKKVEHLAENYSGDPALYFFGVAKRVTLERARQEQPQELPKQIAAPSESNLRNPGSDSERIHECLDKCLQQLTSAERELVLSYYQEAKQIKINSRKELAKQLGIDVETLRVRLHRIRVKIQKCMEECLRQRPSGEMN